MLTIDAFASLEDLGDDINLADVGEGMVNKKYVAYVGLVSGVASNSSLPAELLPGLTQPCSITLDGITPTISISYFEAFLLGPTSHTVRSPVWPSISYQTLLIQRPGPHWI